ncbi:MAG: DUF3575 domain-containing protein, partial [Muribaculaceae bacterium]|nr:DUF3575 domain-containing protein [Muribaculaceae bacterium]
MKYFLSIFLLCCSFCLSAKNNSADSLRLIFRQSYSTIDPSLDKNKERLDSMALELRTLSDSTNFAVSSVSIVGAASPEGPTDFNLNLSQRRARTLFNLASRALLPDSIASFSFIGRNWKGLLEDVKEDKNVPHREEVITELNDILASINAGNPDTNENLSRIKRIAGGVPYRYMYSRFFPTLRTSTLYIGYQPLFDTIPQPDFQPSITTSLYEYAIEQPLPLPESTMNVCKPFYMDIKTNLLYDALLLPNIGVDFYVGKNLSVGANWVYGWWDKDSTHRYWRAYGGDLNFRWWFGRRAYEKPLTGHHLGVFAGVVTYDFEFGGKGYMGGLPDENLWHRCNFISGVEYGYSLPVTRRLNIDFSLAIGYL